MGAFQPNGDQEHDLGTVDNRWKNIHADKLVISGQDNEENDLTSSIGGTLNLKNLNVTGTVTGISSSSSNLNVFIPTGTNHIVADSDELIIHDTGIVILPDATSSINEGRIIRVINNNETDSIAIVSYSQDQNIYSYGFAIGSPNSSGLSVQSHSVATLICTGSHWYSI